MLKRSGHWWNRRRVWYYDRTEQSTSPRPHSLTVRLALLSPLLALVATAISLVSLRRSQTSVEIGQRAYLNIRFQTLGPSPPRVAIIGGVEARESGIWTPKITITNLGNTPAYIDTFTVNFDSGGDHGEVLYNRDDTVGYIPDVLPAKDHRSSTRFSTRYDKKPRRSWPLFRFHHLARCVWS